MKNPKKLTQKRLVSNKFWSGIMWQPVLTRSWTKLIQISCKRPLKVFIPRASRFARLSEYYKFQQRWRNNPLLTASLPLKQRLVTKKPHILIFSLQHKHKSLYMVNSFMSVSIIAWLAYDINRGGGKHHAKPGLMWKNEFPAVIH